MVSVIIPIYNGQKYIEKIFKQVKAQTYNDLEVIFVDDGSSDNSARLIMDKMDESQDESILYRLLSQKNTGQGGARNRGIEEAKGEYLLFIDQDDYIKEDYIEYLMSVAEGRCSDIVISGYEHVTENLEIKEHVELSNNDWCRFMNITPWGKLYRRDFIEKNNIRFLPVPLGEDIYFNLKCYSLTNKVVFTNYVGYLWVINEDSVSNTVHKELSKDASVIKLFDALADMDNSDEWMQIEQYRYFMLKTGIFHLLYAAPKTQINMLIEYRNEIFSWFNNHIPGIESNDLVSLVKPRGERTGVRYAVYIYMVLRRMNLDGIFLRIFHYIGR